MMKIRCDISGLDCPHCALELEKLLVKDQSITKANINFPMQSLVLEVEDNLDEDEMVAKAQEIADSFQDGIEIELRD